MQLTIAARRAPQGDRPERQPFLARDPTLLRPEGEEADEGERRGDREALEVRGLALGVFGDERDGRVEAREAGEPAADAAGEHDGVEVRPEADGERE